MFEEIIKKYNLYSNQGLEICSLEEYIVLSEKLFDSWETKFFANTGAFETGLIPKVWFNVISDVLEKIYDLFPQFFIYTIKIKNGQIRFCLGGVSDEVLAELLQVENVLYDERLIY